MKISHSPVFLWTAILWFSVAGAADIEASDPTVTDTASVPSQASAPAGLWAEVPFHVEENKIVVPVRVNGAGPFNFVLDTGAGSALFLDGERAQDLELNLQGEVDLRGAGEDKGTLVDLAAGVRFSIGEMSLDDNHMVVARPGQELLGSDVPWDGIVGRQVLDHAVTQIDWQQGKIRFYDPELYRVPTGSAELDLEIGHTGHAFVRAELEDDKGTSHPLRLVIDSGAFHAVALHASALGATAAHFPGAYLGRGLGGVIHGRYARVPKLRLADFELGDVLAQIPDDDFASSITLGSDGNLGAEILRRFTVTFDYSRKRMVLESNDDFDAPFELANTFGAEVEADDELFQISAVYSGSPAAESGLKVGDRLLSVDGRSVGTLSEKDVRDSFKQPVGTDVELQVERDGRKLSLAGKCRALL